MQQEFTTLTISVPTAHLGDLYGYLASLTEAATDPPEHLSSPSGVMSAWDPNSDRLAAMALYHRSSAQARELLDILIDAPGVVHAIEDVARRMDLEPAALSGVMSWPARRSSWIGRPLPFTLDRAADTIVMAEDVADLFSRARAALESGETVDYDALFEKAAQK